MKIKGMHGGNFHVQSKKMEKVSKLEKLNQIWRSNNILLYSALCFYVKVK